MINPDFASKLPPEEFESLKPKALEFIHSRLTKDKEWNRCYQLKQTFTREVSYCFQADFYEYLRMAGFSVKIDERGDHLAKARYRVIKRKIN
jgi:hypothetical protein